MQIEKLTLTCLKTEQEFEAGIDIDRLKENPLVLRCPRGNSFIDVKREKEGNLHVIVFGCRDCGVIFRSFSPVV